MPSSIRIPQTSSKSLTPTPAQKVARCIHLVSCLHTLVLHSLAEMAEKPATEASNEPRQMIHERVKEVVAWLTVVGSLCGSVNNIWNVVVLLRKMRLTRLLGQVKVLRG
ncbi:hypothetical protein HBI53_107110 [Parastagonospora nodorum]|nr:hypothetical protein HBI53_107110 [Parastagonospora nodorum]